MANVLIVDDDQELCRMMAEIVRSLGHQVSWALSLKQGLDQAASQNLDVVFLDVGLPDGNGLQLLPTIRATPSSPEVIIITGAGDPDGAELAIRNGAWAYLEKPFSKKELILQLTRALQYRDQIKAPGPPVALNREGIVGSSPQIMGCLDLVAQAAHSQANVLITGETGTGKELFAQAIHRNSPRAEKNFVVVDCAALPQTLVESVLFGHVKGAFTGAATSREGLVKQAHGGTLFLDEVGELPLSVQKAFLRVLQERRFRPLGAGFELESDFRLIAATNRNLDQMVKKGLFRSDLLFRLRTISIHLPPLRERPQDIIELALYHITRLCRQYGTGTKGLAPEFLEALTAYPWPGNVRELFNTLERALTSARYEPTLFPVHLPTSVRVHLIQASVKDSAQRKSQVAASPEPGTPPAAAGGLPTLKDFRQEAVSRLERQYLKDLLSLAKGNITQACSISGLSRSRLYALLKKYRLTGLARLQSFSAL